MKGITYTFLLVIAVFSLHLVVDYLIDHQQDREAVDGKEPLEPHQSPEDLPNVNYQVDEEEVEEEIIPQPDQEEDHLIVDQLNLENRMDDKERLGHMNYIVVKQAGMDEEDDFVDITET